MLNIHRHQDGIRSFANDTACYGALAQHDAGIQSIPISAIVGSVGRCHELRPNFTSREWPWGGDARYRSICQAMSEGLPLPAIEVYKLGDCYYVIDGHHRVAAARAAGQISIDAEVIEVHPILSAQVQAAA